MRYSMLARGLVLGFLFLAQGAFGATLQSYAKVNLVQGTEVQPQPTTDPGLQFLMTGPADQQVSVQLSALAPEAEWDDPAIPSGVQLTSAYDSDGLMLMDLSPELLTQGYAVVEDPTADSARLVLSIIYE